MFICLYKNFALDITIPSLDVIVSLITQLKVQKSDLYFVLQTLRLSKSALADITTGQIVNLMASDLNRFEFCFLNIHYLWIGPITVSCVAFFLLRQVGVAGFIGMVALVASVPFQCK